MQAQKNQKVIIDQVDRFKNKRRERKIKNRKRIFLFVLSFLLLVILFLFYYKNKKYNRIEKILNKEISVGSFVSYQMFQKGFVKYSKDGVIFLDKDTKELFIDAYDMKEPIFASSKKFFAIGDKRTGKIKIFNNKGRVAEVEESLNIKKIDISDTGVLVALVEDSVASYIKFYTSSGKILDIKIKSILEGDGYPTDLSISPNSSQLLVSYQYLKEGKLHARVVFYDFSEKGKNIPSRVIAGFDNEFKESFLVRVKHLENYAFAISDKGIYFFSLKKTLSPVLLKNKTKNILDKGEIKSISFTKKHIALVYKSDKENNRYEYVIYNIKGDEILRKAFDYEYTYFSIDDKNIYFQDANKNLKIYNFFGKLKINTEIEMDLKLAYKEGYFNTFLLLGRDVLQKVKLK